MPKFESQGTTVAVLGKRRNLRNPAVVGPGGAVGSDSHVTTVISDTFTHADNFNMSGQVPDVTNTPGHTYVVARGSWIINGNKLFTGVSGATISIACDSNDITVDVDITTGSAIDVGLGFGMILHMQTNADTTGTYCGWDNGIGYRVGNGGVNVSPVLTTLAGTSPVANTTYHWKFIATSGGVLDWYIDGALLTHVTGCSTAFGTGVSCFQFAPTNRIKFDNLVVKT